MVKYMGFQFEEESVEKVLEAYADFLADMNEEDLANDLGGLAA